MHTSTLLQLQDLQSDTRLQCSNISRLKAQNFQQLRPNWGCLEEHTRQQLHPAKSCSPAGGGGYLKTPQTQHRGNHCPGAPQEGDRRAPPSSIPFPGGSPSLSPHTRPLSLSACPWRTGLRWRHLIQERAGGGGGTPKKPPRGCRQAGGEARGRAGSGPAATMAVICFR